MSNKETLLRAVEFMREIAADVPEPLHRMLPDDPALQQYMSGKEDGWNGAANYLERLIVIIED